MSESSSFPIVNLPKFKEKLVHWANQFSVFICLDNHDAEHLSQELDFVVAVDQVKQLKLSNEPNQIELVKEFRQNSQGTIYGYFSYDLKNQVEDLESNNPDKLHFPNTYFFQPRYTFHITDGHCVINRSTIEALHLMDQIEAIQVPASRNKSRELEWMSSMTKEEYVKYIDRIRNDILEGTVYEMNFCRELHAQVENFSSLEAFLAINPKAKAPFSTYLKINEQQVCCFSPERFMKHQAGILLSQPIKGTIQKGESEKENEALKKQLFYDEKERAENVMIVDLVRNDFARSAKPGSVVVDELFGIYEFENIIQMISTVRAELLDSIHPLDALKNAFPMGSMTGAPKIMAMKLIEEYEQSKRGVYSGAIGYIDENLNYDFNVVIRTLLYNEKNAYLSLQVGGAITYDAIAEKEWVETEIKANSILQFLV